MVNFGPLAAEIDPVVWGTPANFNGFRILAALLHGTSSGHQQNIPALNRGHHLYSAWRPSRWALALISSFGSVAVFEGCILSIDFSAFLNHFGFIFCSNVL